MHGATIMDKIKILVKQVIMKTNRRVFLLCVTFVVILLNVSPVFAEESPTFAGAASSSGKPRIIVFGFLNLTGDSSFSIPTETATENLTFSLRLLNRYETIETDMFLRYLSDERLARYCALTGMDFILYGTLIQDSDGRQNYELSVFDREKGETTVRDVALGESVMDVFDISDRLSASVLGSILGRKLTFGSIQILNEGKPVEFNVFIDDVPVRSSEGTIDHVPDGPHHVHLVRKGPIPWGTPSTLDFDVTVEDSVTAVVSFAFESLSVAGDESDGEDPWADWEEEEEIPDIPLREGLMVSAYAFGNAPVGKFIKVVEKMVGGGGSFEYAWSRFGCAVRGQWCTGFPEDDAVDEYSALSAFGGVFVRSSLAGGRAELRMELDGGIWQHKISFYGNTDMSGTQIDAVIQASLAFRAHSRFVGFELAPVVTVLPEESDVIVMGGVRAGLVFGGKK